MIKKLFLGIDFKRVRMIKICCTKCKNYKEYEKPKVSNICDKRLFFYSICNKCRSEDEKIFKEEESIKTLKDLV